MIQSWYRERSLPVPEAPMLPVIGFVEEGVAAGFLVRTDTTLALLDGFVTNPAAQSNHKDIALDDIVDAIIEEARFLGFTALMAITKSEAIKARATMWRFDEDGTYTGFYKDID